MEEHAFPAAERIINDIGLAFKKDPKLKEFQILPVSLNENKSPVHHVEHSLGLESWCVPHVYCYAYNLLMDFKQQRRRREDAEHVNQLLTGALLLNPDVTVLWNMRRELLNSDPQFELHFTSVVLTRKPKSSEVFNYRKWLIKKLMDVVPHDDALVKAEVHVCQLAAERYPNNYYAWNHRIWCLNQLPPHTGSYISFLVDEWIVTHKWVSSHVSDHSGFQYRQQLLDRFIRLPLSGYATVRKCTSDIEQNALWSLKRFFSPFENIRDNQLTNTTKLILKEALSDGCEQLDSIPLGLILSELLFNTDLIFVYPGHEAIWCHRRFLLHVFQECLYSLTMEADKVQKDKNGVSVEKTKRMEDFGCNVIQRLVNFETVFYSYCKASKDRQASYAEKHRAWLASIMKLNLHLPFR